MSRIIEATDPFIFQTIRYPAGEYQVRVRPESLDLVQDVTAICVRGGDPETLMQGMMAYNAVQFLLQSKLSFVFPYMPYGRADRQFTHGDCFGLLAFLSMVDGMATDFVYTLDLHGKVPRPTLSAVPTTINVPADSIMLDAYNHVYTLTGIQPVVLLPDAGAAGRYEYIFPVGTVFLASKRRDGATGQLSGFDVPTLPAGRPVLIVDDICDGGGTFLGIASALRSSYQMNSLHLHVTHGVFSNNAVSRLHAAGFQSVTSTDSLPSAAGSELSLGADRLFQALPIIQQFMEANA